MLFITPNVLEFPKKNVPAGRSASVSRELEAEKIDVTHTHLSL
jgi:hypothetical protein